MSSDTLGPRETIHDRIHQLHMDLKGLERRAEGLAAYELPPDVAAADLIMFSLHIFDDPLREVDVNSLKETFEKCGQYRTLSVDNFIFSTHPYLHQGGYADTIEGLQRTGLIISGKKLQLTEQGAEAAKEVFAKLYPNNAQA